MSALEAACSIMFCGPAGLGRGGNSTAVGGCHRCDLSGRATRDDLRGGGSQRHLNPGSDLRAAHPDRAHSLLNNVAHRMVDSGPALQNGDRIEGVLIDDVPLVAVAMTDTTDLNLVRECYGAVAAAAQVVWPDRAGVLPWEEGSRLTDTEQPVAWAPTGGAAGVSRQAVAGGHRA